MKLHVGCGRHVLDGYVNVDIARAPKAKREPEVLADISKPPLPFPDGSCEEVLAVHVVEHFYRWEIEPILLDWRRLLGYGGSLVLELPDLRMACQNLLRASPGGDQMHMWPLYGDPGHRDPHMCHRWGYTPETMKALLSSLGFVEVKSVKPQWHGGRLDRDMRIEARKPRA